jgi:hypothetical protein
VKSVDRLKKSAFLLRFNQKKLSELSEIQAKWGGRTKRTRAQDLKGKPKNGFIFNPVEGSVLNQQLQKLKNNIDAKIVTSVVVGTAIFGAIVFAAVRTGIKPLKTVADVAKGGK